MHLLSSLFRGWNTNIFFDGSLLKLGLDQTEWLVLLGALLILLAVSLMQEKGVSVLEASQAAATLVPLADLPRGNFRRPADGHLRPRLCGIVVHLLPILTKGARKE